MVYSGKVDTIWCWVTDRNYGRYDLNKSMIVMIKKIIDDCGWKEPIKGCVLKLIDSMNGKM